jgi:hypothetical protein
MYGKMGLVKKGRRKNCQRSAIGEGVERERGRKRERRAVLMDD